MVKKILMLLLPLLGFVGGAIGGDLLHAPKSAGKDVAVDSETATGGGTAAAHDDPAAQEAGAEHAAGDASGAGHGEGDASAGALDWFKFPNQFFVPIIRNGTPTAIMVLTLSIEMPAEARPGIEAQEARLRDALLGALMIEANTGGFDGNFTSETRLRRLRESLLAAGRRAGGGDVRRILIEDIGRQQQ